MSSHKLDSIPLDSLRESSSDSKKNTSKANIMSKLINFKTLISLFIIFALVVSDVFTNNIVSGFNGAVQFRTPTSFGVVVQGIFLVIFYVLALNMIESDLI